MQPHLFRTTPGHAIIIQKHGFCETNTRRHDFLRVDTPFCMSTRLSSLYVFCVLRGASARRAAVGLRKLPTPVRARPSPIRLSRPLGAALHLSGFFGVVGVSMKFFGPFGGRVSVSSGPSGASPTIDGTCLESVATFVSSLASCSGPRKETLGGIVGLH